MLRNLNRASTKAGTGQFHRRPVPTGGLAERVFRAFYEVVRLAVGRLCCTVVDGVPLLRWLGPARQDLHTKESDGYGQRWTMAGSVVDRCVDARFSAETRHVLFHGDLEVVYETFARWDKQSPQEYALAMHTAGPCGRSFSVDDYVQESASGGPLLVNVAGVYDALTARDLKLHDAMVEAAAKSGGVDRAERRVIGLVWQRRLARQHDRGSAHVSVGAWRRGEARGPARRERICTVPFLVADVDVPTLDLECALVVVRLLLGRLVALGVRAEDLIVSYTGGKGFHVRIPHGLVGRPLWPRAAGVSQVLARFFARLCDGLETPDGPLIDSLDAALFSPAHLVRAVGSEHERHPGRWCVGYRGDDFLRLVDALGDGVLDVVEAHSRSPELASFSLPDPDRPASVPALQAMLRASIDDVRVSVEVDPLAAATAASRGIIDAIRRGVRPGEEFAPGHVGRNEAAFLLSLYLLTNGRLSEPAAWAELERWNAANPVPLGAAEGDDDGELERAFVSACKSVSSHAS